MAADDARLRTALVLAGGGSFGAIQVGMLHSLATHGIAADMVVGSSVGSLNGAYYAGNPTLEGIERLEAIWRALRRSDVFPVNWAAMLGFLLRRNFLVEPHGLRMLIERNLTYRNLEDAKIPIHIVATNILTGGTVVLSEGSAAQAIIASAAIPAVFPPVKFEDSYLVDGAVSSNTAVKVAVDQGAPLTGSPYDFSQTGALIDRAIKSTDAWIADGGFEKPNVHAQLSIHKHDNQKSVSG